MEPLLEACYSGLETGELNYAASAANLYSVHFYYSGKNLFQTRQKISKYIILIDKLKQDTFLNLQKIFAQIVLNLIAESNEPCCLVGSVYDEQVMLPIHKQANDTLAIFNVYNHKMFLYYLFGNYYQARKNMVCAQAYFDAAMGTVVVPVFFFYSSLINLAIYNDTQVAEKRNVLNKVKANQKKMKKWAKYAPMNHLHKWHLVEAELARVRGKNIEAMEHYDRAITLAGTNEYTQEQALANELAAKFYLELGKQNIAQLYLTQAYYCYALWGAKAKVDDLELGYPELLAPILQPEKISLDAHNTIPTIGITTISSKSTISEALDWASVVKASCILSGEIQLEQLLSTLMQVVMQNAGASKCALILHYSNNLRVGVSAVTALADGSSDTPTATVIQSTPLESSPDVPITLINYVYRTQESLVIDDVFAPQSVSLPVLSDRYILEEQPKSLLCIPMINQGKLQGILYLENNLTTGAFTGDRVEILKLITTQAAICLENATLYENLAQANQHLEDANHSLEQKVALRTQEIHEKNQSLAQTLKELKLTQAQLIQSEKMSSLGQMVAGIAHEINNPTNFIQANITYANEYVQSLLDLVAVYQQEYPNESAVIKKKAKDIDLDFLVEDLPKLFNSMEVGCSRIENIVLGLRNFSRLDESQMKPVDIHEGIESTLMILQHRLKPQNNSYEIQVIKEYGQLPKITCYASGMNQVFMNILSNAIDALQEVMGNRELGSQKEIPNSPLPTISIHTQLADNNTVKICITDNGIGMSAEVKERIFDPFFTTKPVGSGTGLGLSISYQIVVEKHAGQLTCISTLGQGTTFAIQIPIALSAL